MAYAGKTYSKSAGGSTGGTTRLRAPATLNCCLLHLLAALSRTRKASFSLLEKIGIGPQARV